MTGFRYARDPLCMAACACYAMNRWLVPLALKGFFLRNYFADALLIPAALPLILWVQRRTGLRTADARPNWREILLHLTVWSVAAEVVAPHLFSRATGDPWDVVAYAGGALLSGLVWQLG
jgi:membrane-associated PAP2 superfamily phosphatase